MRAVWRTSVVALFAGLMVAAGQAGVDEKAWKERPQRSIMTTGIPLIYHQDKASAVTVVGLYIAGGKAAVPEGLDGLAYLTTRLTLEIPDEGKIQDLMVQATRMSHFCLEDCSAIVIECLSENLEAALRVAAKIIQDPLMTGLRISRVKEMMKLFAQAEEDDAVLTGHNAALDAFFQGKGYGSASYGSDDSRKAIERKDILAFYRRLFTSKGVFFSVVTDLDRAPVQSLLEGCFSGFPGGERTGIPATPLAAPSDREIVRVKGTKQTYIGRAFALPAPGPIEQAKGYLVEVLLGRGPGSRLWGLRATDKLAYNVNAHLTWTRSAGILEAYLETENAKAARAAEALDRSLAELWESGVTPEELETAKTLSKAVFLRSTEAKTERAKLLGLFEVLGLGYDHLSGIFGTIDAVTLDGLNAFIRESLPPERALKIAVGPALSAEK